MVLLPPPSDFITENKLINTLNNYVTYNNMNNTLSTYVKKKSYTVSDINSIRYGGFYDIYGSSQMPSLDWYWIIFLPHSSNNENYRYGTYLAGLNGSNKLYICNAINGQVITSSSWSQL